MAELDAEQIQLPLFLPLASEEGRSPREPQHSSRQAATNTEVEARPRVVCTRRAWTGDQEVRRRRGGKGSPGQEDVRQAM